MTDFDERKLILNDNGDKVLPKSADDWKSWITASRTRSYSINDPVLDWLDLHGKNAGFKGRLYFNLCYRLFYDCLLLFS